MTATTTYSCDLCGCEFDETQWDAKLSCFAHWGVRESVSGGVKRSQIQGASRHICQECVKSIAFEWTKLQPGDPK